MSKGTALLAGLAGLLWFAVLPVHAQTGGNCGSVMASKPGVGGPYDYRKGGTALPMVESNHFTPPIEALIRGRTGPLWSELSFVLHAFPNHHRALAALVRFGEREKSSQPGGLDYSIDCYFERALSFRPDDAIVRMLYADYLSKFKQDAAAVSQIERAKADAADNPFTQYNVGLLYFQLGRYKDALAQAHRAMALGNPRTDLMEKLKAKGEWAEPPSAGDAAAPAASTPGS